MKSVGKAGKNQSRVFDRPREPAEIRGTAGERVVAQRRLVTRFSQPQPMMMKGDLLDRQAVPAKGMQVGVSEPPPIAKLDAQLERRLGLADELILVDPEQLVESANWRNGRFADANRADLGRLDQRDTGVAEAQDAR